MSASILHRVSLGSFNYRILINCDLFGKNARNLSNLKSEPLSEVKPINMAYSLHGSKNIDDSPVVIMHGLFGSKNNWNSLSKAVQEKTKKQVYTVDVRNHGDSPHTKEHSYIHIAEDIRYFLEEHGIEKVALIGHSMGGRGVMAFAFKYPQYVQSLTVVDISPVGTTKSLIAMKKVFIAMKSVKLNKNMSLFEARREVERQLFQLLGDKRISSFLTLNLVEKSSGDFSWKINVNDVERNYEPHMTIFPYKTGQFAGPTLFVMGAESDYVSLDDEDAIREMFLNVDIVKIEGAGHWLHVEKPTQFLDTACKFINGNK